MKTEYKLTDYSKDYTWIGGEENQPKQKENTMKQFLKADLKDGMIVKYKNAQGACLNSSYRIKIGNTFVGPEGRSELCYYNENLEHVHNRNIDIVEVYDTPSCLDSFKDSNIERACTKLLWKREEEKTISVDEAMKQLEKVYGCKVKLEWGE